ncbi:MULTISPECIES: cytochrome c oxidase subunit 4 [Janibacter]|uniref:Cytochrome c oxidase polypeptide 4 n=1 Tax=Janibacter indicus TaxID=857417 RepID=A0A1W2A4G2_9MICO|nr:MULTISPECIES: cytochrome c oxidase subunit 4 [Janibacter]QNF95434.1 cytochrome c oxidase subunit 4 [Janibacter sp. YB324]SMC55473.1 Cytochrome c oxidase subunit IV [Janibacter indicus]
MKSEIQLFAVVGAFFAVVAVGYGIVTDWVEPVGWVTLFLSAGLGFMIAFFLWNTARKLPFRPDDDEDGEIEQAEGPYGTFAPYSWWPLWLSLAGSLVFLGVAVGLWVSAFGALVGVWALCGWVFEYYKGEHAH